MVESPLDGVKLRLITCLDDALEVKRWLGERRETPIAFDVESGGLDPFRHRLRLIQLGDLHAGYVIPFPSWGGLAKELFASYDGKLIGHNSGFDHRFLSIHAGIDIPWYRVEDTMVLAGLDNPGRSKALKSLADTLVDPRASSGQETLNDGMRENGWDWDTVPDSYTPWWAYAALDPVLTCHIWKYLHPRVMSSCSDAYDLELGTTRIISNMMKAGLLTDQPYITKAIAELREKSHEIREWLFTAYGITTPNSGPQIARAFKYLDYPLWDFSTLEEFEQWHGRGQTPLERSGATVGMTNPSSGESRDSLHTGKTQQPRVDKEILQYIGKSTNNSDVRNLARSVYAVRHSERVISSYLENFLDMADRDGVIRCSIWQMTAKTGRMSVTEPALQTLHRDDKVVRGSFIPRPGNVFISCDFSQVELRLAASLSGDEGLIRAFKEADSGGSDFFTNVVSEIYGESVAKDDKRRQAVKTLSYAKLYGAGVATMARSIGLPHDQVKVIHDGFNSRYPGLERLMNETAAGAWKQKNNGEEPAVVLASGRRLPVDKEHAACNYTIQGTAAEVLKRAGLNVEAAGMGDMMRLFVHDELLAEVPKAEAEDYRRAIEDAMTDHSYAVPLTCQAKILPERWVK